MRIHKPWYTWECHKSGMWRRLSKIDEEETLLICIKFISDHKKYGKYMNIVIKKWPNSMINFLTNPSVNKKAYIGHCAVQYAINCPEYITRMAWKYLTQDERDLADNEAIQCYHKFMKSINKGVQIKIDCFEIKDSGIY